MICINGCPIDAMPTELPTPRFWETKSLDEMSASEWEALCDGCGRCCLNKLEDEDTAEVHFTNVACQLLDTNTCRCSDYQNRFSKVPDCLAVRPLTDEKSQWLPKSCAYRRLAEGRPLLAWHPLLSGDARTVQQAGISMAGRCTSEVLVSITELPQHLITLID